MRFRTFTSALLGAILLTFIQRAPMSARAEERDTPLLLIFGGDIWAWTGPDHALDNLTHSGGVIVGNLSPDGTQVAYAEMPELVRNAYEARGWPGLVAYDVRVLNLATGTHTLIAGQPADIEFIEGHPYNDIMRTFPVWSPDGTMLAWTEQAEDSQRPELVLMIYSLVEKRVVLTREIALIELPTQVQWGVTGIALQNMSDDKLELVYQIVDIEGNVVASTLAPGYESDNYRWIHDGQGDNLFLHVSGIDQEEKFFDPVSGQLTSPSDTFELYALSAPEGASLLSSRSPVGYLMSTDLKLAFPGRRPIDLPGEQTGVTVDLQYSYLSYTASISPSGQSVAYAHDGTVTIARDGQWIETNIETDIEPPYRAVQVLWSAVGWRVPITNNTTDGS